MADNLGRSKDKGRLNTQCFGSKALQHLAEHNRVRAARADEFHFLRGERRGHIHQLFTIFCCIKLLFTCINRQGCAGFHRIFLFQNRIAVIIQDRVTRIIQLFDPVFQIHTNPAGDPDGGLENR